MAARESAARAQDLLEETLGEGVKFREGQLAAILALVDQRRRALVVQRTGWGKSIVYFLATRLLRDAGVGPTLLISPLLSLMRDQQRMAERLGVQAESINSTNRSEWGEIEERLGADEIDLLLVSPERLGNEDFRRVVREAMPRGIGLFVVDEAHCISDWGHDFRPDYRRIGRLVSALPGNVPLLATTATANDRVIADIQEQLGQDLLVVRGPLARESLGLQVVEMADQADRLAWLAERLPALDGSGIVYALTIADAERVSGWLRSKGIDAPAYHGQLSNEDRQRLEQRLLENDVKALVATIALGMGFDKRDLGFVVHYQRPGSAVAYYQQIGRAGRELASAPVVLLAGHEDDEIAAFFIRGAFPGEDTLREVVEAVSAASEGLTARQLEPALNVPQGKILQALNLLEVDGALYREDGRFQRAASPWKPDVERMQRVTAERRREQERMREFVATGACLMEFLVRELDDPSAQRCGRCRNCAGESVTTSVDDGLAQEAITFLRRTHRPIQPRKRWPGGLAEPRGKITIDERLEEGRSLATYNDAGWGRLIAATKHQEELLGDELVDAVVEMIEKSWHPEPAPTWVTAIPSLRRSELVPDLAARVADRLALPLRAALVKVRETQPQKLMQNSAQQVMNIYDAFEAEAGAVEADEPLLLVDDIVDSRWSLTVCGVKLRRAGAGPVFPVTLASASARD